MVYCIKTILRHVSDLHQIVLQICIFKIIIYLDNIAFNNICHTIIMFSFKKTFKFIKYIFKKNKLHWIKFYVHLLWI